MIDMSRYRKCPHCHTYQGCLTPCRKCGWHKVAGKCVPVPSYGIYTPLAERKARINGLAKELGLLRELSDGEWYPIRDLCRSGLMDKWIPRDYAWQSDLMLREIVETVKEHNGHLRIRIHPDRMQDAADLRKELEVKVYGKDKCGKA